MTTICILGAGKVGTVLARLAVAAGYRTAIAASGNPEAIRLIVDVMAPGATPATATQAVRDADIVILAIPLSRYRALPAVDLGDKVVIDAMNYWPPTDGTLPEFESGTSSSEVIQWHLTGARLVKTFSHLGYHQLDEDGRPAGAPGRHAIAIAGDDELAVRAAAELVNRMGFDPVHAGRLAAGSRFAPGSPPFGVSTDRRSLESLLDQTGQIGLAAQPDAATA